MDGLGTAVDYDEARKWTEMAADKGQPIGLNNMGHIYENGLGVDVDLALAKSYYEQSAAQGYQLAVDNLARLNQPATGGKTKSK
jgi:TPR repeat protein